MKIKSYIVKIKQNIAKNYKKNKKLFVLIVALIVVMVCYLFYSLTYSNSSTKETSDKNVNTIAATCYEEKLELKLKNLLLQISEVKHANVMVVCDSTEIVHYLKNNSRTETSGDNSSLVETSEVVFEKNGSSSSPVVEYKTMPKVLGVMVVLNDVSPATKLAIINSIAVVLNLDASCISIVLD